MKYQTQQDLVIEADKILSGPEVWTQGASFRTPEGAVSKEMVPGGTCCAHGALLEAFRRTGSTNTLFVGSIVSHFDTLARLSGYDNLPDLNDRADFPAVKKLFALALETH